VLDIGRLDLAASGGDLTVSVATNVVMTNLKTASLASTSGTITLAQNAVVSAGDVTFTATKGALAARSGALVSGESLKIRVGQGIGSEGSPLRTDISALDVATESGDIFINETDSVTIKGAGVSIASGAGKIGLTAAKDILMQPPAGLTTAGGSFRLQAGGDVGLSQVDTKAGTIQVDAGGRIFDNTGGAVQAMRPRHPVRAWSQSAATSRRYPRSVRSRPLAARLR
jgi:hypothetical protein